MQRRCLALAVTVLVTACSNRQLFDTVQHNQRLECGKLPQAQYEECMREIDVSYEEYERAREARKSENSNSSSIPEEPASPKRFSPAR